MAGDARRRSEVADCDLAGCARLDGAACVGHPNPDLWFADPTTSLPRLEASRICAGCPVKAACESFAESSHQQHGSWGDIRCVA
ncbi:hypothetical protein GS903_21975, partial [Rhodococcus hoagii]|nr:hypothetical protein [Prescottella equi]